MKKIVLSCACCLLAVGLLTACNNDDEVEDDGAKDDGTVVEPVALEGTYYFGFEVDGVMTYIDGGTVEGYDREGTLTTDITKAAQLSVSYLGSEYYLSFTDGGTTKWITTIVSGSYVNLSYATSESPIYLIKDGDYEYFGNESGTYYLGYYPKYDCLYASELSYLDSEQPAGLYDSNGKLVAGGVGVEIEPEPEPDPIEWCDPEDAGEFFFGFEMSHTLYYATGEMSGYYGAVSSSFKDAAVVTVGAVKGTDELSDTVVGYTLSVAGESDATSYIALSVSTSTDETTSETTTHHNFVYSDTAFTWTYDEDYGAFVAEDEEGVAYTIGTYSTYKSLSVSPFSYVTGEEETSTDQYVAHLYPVIVPAAPEYVTISAPTTTIYPGESIQLVANIDEDAADGITWSTSDTSSIITLSDTGLVTASSSATGSVTVTATATHAPEGGEAASDSVTITVAEPTYAASETITASELGYSNGEVISDVYGSLAVVSFDVGEGSTKPAYYNDGTNLRVYKNNTITFSERASSVATISSITITYTANYGGNTGMTVSGGTVTAGTGNTLVITPCAELEGDIVLTNSPTALTEEEKADGTKEENTQLRITSIAIVYTDVTNAGDPS